ncbi:MAG TPA: DUF1684 domain-containing protein [Gemmatimonadales bacterium]|nr:DUF1684 domain-containing protein [Gemmatimonadales bacterium]
MRAAAITAAGWLLLASAAAPTMAAQSPDAVAAERAAYAAWIGNAATSPAAAVAQQPIGDGLVLGAGAAVPLTGIDARVKPVGGRMVLETRDGSRALARYRPVSLGRYTIVPGGTARKPMLTVFDSTRPRKAPHFYAHDPALVLSGTLTPPERPAMERLLAPDGIEVEATEAGSVLVPLGGTTTRLKVMRIPDPSTGESDLEIYFRDSTNASETYPAGRFVALVPLGNGRYRLDFNRARNPFCAYSSAYACPIPWRGNAIPAPVRAGERYEHQ